jgi:dTDP-4-dehydrorhamnose reductase
MTHRILVTGRRGQLAGAIAAADPSGLDVQVIGRPDLDLTDPASIDAVLDKMQPDLIVNTAAYTDVDGAEREPDACRAVNADGARDLAEAARQRGLALMHISTDCVFDGRSDHAYREIDGPSPLSVYGASKLAGEEAVCQLVPRHLVIRVSWVFSRFGSSFPEAMLRLARERDSVSVVSDQRGCPTHAEDLAAGLLEMAAQALRPGFGDWGLYHLAGSGQTDRASMAAAIFADSAGFGGPSARVRPVLTADYGAPANRPLNARLDSGKVADRFGVELPHWRRRLRECVRELVTQGDRA